MTHRSTRPNAAAVSSYTAALSPIHKYIVVVMSLLLSGVSLSAAPPVRAPKITLVYTYTP